MKIIQLTYLLFLSTITFGQVDFLNNYDFELGGYSLLGARSESDPNEFADSLGEWYTDDISVLNDFKSEWVFTTPGKHYSCGYHYIVYICKDGKALESFAMNLNCNEIVGEKGYFYFDTAKLSKFKDRLKKPQRDQRKFDDIELARSYVTTILNDSNLIYTQTPDWTRFEGTFDFNFHCSDENFDCLENEEKILEQLKNEIKSKYPEEDFEIEGRGGSNSDVFVEVMCNKSLEEKFDLYKRDPKYNQWESFRLNLRTYWVN